MGLSPGLAWPAGPGGGGSEAEEMKEIAHFIFTHAIFATMCADGFSPITPFKTQINGIARTVQGRNERISLMKKRSCVKMQVR